MSSIIPEGRLWSPPRREQPAEAGAVQPEAQTASQLVLTISCPLCSAPASSTCGLTGSHLARWLRAFALSRITRADLIEAVRGMVVISAAQLVEKRAA